MKRLRQIPNPVKYTNFTGFLAVMYRATDANIDNSIVKLGTSSLPLMKRFNITFDYFNQMMYFEKYRQNKLF